MRDVILATDISRQAEYLCQLRQYLDAADEVAGLDLSETALRRFVLQIALKCADISNPCRWVTVCSTNVGTLTIYNILTCAGRGACRACGRTGRARSSSCRAIGSASWDYL